MVEPSPKTWHPRVSTPYTSSYPGHSGYERIDFEYYREPAWVTDALLRVEQFQGSIYDPFCGGFTIPARFRAAGHAADGSDIRGIGRAARDAFSLTERFDNLVFNPPYKRAAAAIHHLLPLVRGKLCVFLRTNFVHARKRDPLFETTPPIRQWVLKDRPSCPPGIPDGPRDNLGCLIQGEERGGKMDYSWFVFIPGHTGGWTTARIGRD